MTYNEERGIPLDFLQFDLIVPRPEVTIEASESLPGGEKIKKPQIWSYSPKEVEIFVDSLICCFLSFLITQRGSQSYKTRIHFLNSVLALLEAQYHQLATPEELNALPVTQMIKRHLKAENRRAKTHTPVANEDMKWLELPEILTRIVEPLRKECQSRLWDGGLRPITAIAHSFAVFLIWGLLTFVAPRRQQEYRGLRIALECQLPRPEGLTSNQFIHPLPRDRMREKEKKFGYLYKAADGFWYRDMTAESYKTGECKKHGHQKELKVPNPIFPDGRCFYDYLEAYLYGYYLDLKGNWVSGGKIFDTPKYQGTWHSLRMALNPKENHRHLLVMPRTGGAYSQTSFKDIVTSHANRLTGKLITPHFLREIYATWFLDGGYEQLLKDESGLLSGLNHTQIIAALAYAMGTSVKMLLEVYDRRRPEDKRKAVERVMEEVVQKLMG